MHIIEIAKKLKNKFIFGHENIASFLIKDCIYPFEAFCFTYSTFRRKVAYFPIFVFVQFNVMVIVDGMLRQLITIELFQNFSINITLYTLLVSQIYHIINMGL